MKQSFLARVLVTYSLIVFVVLGIVFMVYYAYAQQETRARIEESETASFLNYVEKNEDTLGIFNDIASAVASLQSVDLFAYSGGANYFERLTRVFTDLSTINQRMAVRDIQVAVHKMNDQTAVSSASSLTVDALAGEIGLSPAAYRSILQGLPSSPLFGGHYVFTDHKVAYIGLKNYIDSKIVIVLLMDASRFSLPRSSDRLTASFVLGGSGTSDLRSHAVPVPDFPLDSGRGGPGDVRLYRTGSLTYRWTESKYLNLRYFYAVDDAAAGSRMVFIVFNMLLVFFSACIVAFFFIALFSIRLFRPIDRLAQSLLSLGIDADSSSKSKNELDFITQQVLKIRSSNQELVLKVEDGNRLHRAALVQDILTDSYDSHTVHADAVSLSLDWFEEPCHGLLFDVVDSPGDLAEKRPSILDEVGRIVSEQLRTGYKVEPVPQRQRLPCLIVGSGDTDRLKEKVTSLVSLVDTAFGIRLTAYIGSPSFGIEELHASLHQAHRLRDTTNSIVIKSVYDYRDLPKAGPAAAVYPLDVELQLIQAVEQNNGDRIERTLDHLFSDCVQTIYGDREVRDLWSGALATTVQRAMQKSGLADGPGEQDLRNLVGRFKACESMAALRLELSASFGGILQAVKESRMEKFDTLKKDLDIYIQENLDKNISLIDISEHFNLSPNYMSYLFKNALNENFKDYLSRKRFGVAVRLLRENPSIKHAELAEKIGLTNVNTLIRMFHKYSGSSPGNYLRDNQA